MTTIWQLRAFRLWLVLFVPAALFFGYIALSSAVEIAQGRSELATWIKVEQEKVVRGERAPITPVEVEYRSLAHSSFADRDRNTSILFLIGGLAIPLLAMSLAKAISWIWVKEPNSTRHPSDSPSPERAILEKYLRWYRWSWAVAAAAVAGLLFALEKTMGAIVSAVVQGLGLVVLAWIFLRLKDWWVWRKK